MIFLTWIAAALCIGAKSKMSLSLCLSPYYCFSAFPSWQFSDYFDDIQLLICFHAVLEHALLLCDVHYGELVDQHDGGHQHAPSSSTSSKWTIRPSARRFAMWFRTMCDACAKWIFWLYAITQYIHIHTYTCSNQVSFQKQLKLPLHSIHGYQKDGISVHWNSPHLWTLKFKLKTL